MRKILKLKAPTPPAAYQAAVAALETLRSTFHPLELEHGDLLDDERIPADLRERIAELLEAAVYATNGRDDAQKALGAAEEARDENYRQLDLAVLALRDIDGNAPDEGSTDEGDDALLSLAGFARRALTRLGE